jgi:hypothetical protein
LIDRLETTQTNSQTRLSYLEALYIKWLIVEGSINIINVGNSCPQALAQYSGDILGLRELVIDF